MLRHTSIFLSLLVPGTAGIPAAEIIEEKVHLRSAVYIRIEGLHTSQDLAVPGVDVVEKQKHALHARRRNLDAAKGTTACGRAHELRSLKVVHVIPQRQIASPPP